MSGLSYYEVRESLARLILAIGLYEDMHYTPTYEDLARATGRSISRIRSIVADSFKYHENFFEKIDVRGRIALKLTPKGREVYKDILKAIIDHFGPQIMQTTIENIVKALDKLLYSDRKREKVVGSTVIAIDVAVPALNLPEVIDRIKAEVGPKIITGLATELATAVELAATSGLGNVGYGDLAKTVINVPLRVVRVSDVALPPHIQGLLSLKTLFEGLKTVSVWPGNANIKDIYRYANEADAYGLVKLHRDANNIADSLVEPLLGSSLEVVEKVSSVGFNTIIANPSRAWIPILSVYGDATSKFPTTTELIDCDTDLLRILRDTEGFGHERCEEWAKHMLGMNTKRSFKVPALARKSPRTFGVLEIIKFGDEERVLSLTVARRIVAANITVTSLVNVLDEVKQRIEEIIKRGGVYGEILKIISQGGFIERERFERDVRKFLEQYKVEENPNIVIRTLEGFGFIHSTALGYYSAWTITPIGFVDEHGKTVIDENKRLISAWMAKEVFSSKYKDTIMDRIIRRLIEKGEVDIIKEIDDEKTRIAVAKRLGFLEKASLVKTVDESETTIRLTGPEAKKILTVVYLAYYLGMKLPEIPIEEEKKPNLGETLIEVGKKFKIMK